jgi:hypothetical protein
MVFSMAAIELNYPAKANIRRGMPRRNMSDACAIGGGALRVRGSSETAYL